MNGHRLDFGAVRLLGRGALGFWVAAALGAGCSDVPTSETTTQQEGLVLPGEPVVGAAWPDGSKKIEWHIEQGDTVGLRMYHSNGQVDREGALDHGARVGVWNAYHPNGNPWARHTYVEGIQTGAYQTWHPNGTPHITGQYDADGNKVGSWRFQDSTGAVVGEKSFDLPVSPDSVSKP